MKKAILFFTILAFCFISCDDLFDDDDNDGGRKGKNAKASEKKVKDIKYTVTPDNGTDTNSIEFSFADDVKGLKAKDIHIKNKSGSVIKGKLSGSGASWSLEVVTSVQGIIEVKIIKPGIDDKKKNVNVFRRINISAPEKCDCCNCECENNCGADCDEFIEYDCYNCKDQGCDDCNIIAY